MHVNGAFFHVILKPQIPTPEQWNKIKLETKASSHQGQCIPAGSSVSPPRMVLITIYILLYT